MSNSIRFWTTVDFGTLRKDNNLKFEQGEEGYLDTIEYKGEKYGCWNDVMDDDDCLLELKCFGDMSELLLYLWETYDLYFYYDGWFELQDICYIRDEMYKDDLEKAERIIEFCVCRCMREFLPELEDNPTLIKKMEEGRADYEEYEEKFKEEQKKWQSVITERDTEVKPISLSEDDDDLPF